MAKHYYFAFVEQDGTDLALCVCVPHELVLVDPNDYDCRFGQALTEEQYNAVVEHLTDHRHPHDFLTGLMELRKCGQIKGELVGYCVNGNTYINMDFKELHRWEIECRELDDEGTFLSHTWTAEAIPPHL
jgi:hypothetical protein